MRAPAGFFVAFVCLPLLAAPARANDSTAQTALGGLTLTKSDAISMDSEDLYISRDLVRVKYRFTNTTDAPIETLVAFPLPEIPPEQPDDSGYWGDPNADLKFTTKVNGEPLALQLAQQALFHGRDVTARLVALGIPLNHFAKDFSATINRLPKSERDKLVAEELIRDDGMSNEQLWAGLWALRTTLTRRQTFPANATITVEHEYKPIAGGSVGGGVNDNMRNGENAGDFAKKRRDFCIDDDWLKSIDRKLGARRNDSSAYSEVWLGYVLKTGANWKGPIKEFRLVVDKGKPDSLVSFCAEGVKKISPTQFESRRSNYTPTRDLNVLILDWAKR